MSRWRRLRLVFLSAEIRVVSDVVVPDFSFVGVVDVCCSRLKREFFSRVISSAGHFVDLVLQVFPQSLDFRVFLVQRVLQTFFFDHQAVDFCEVDVQFGRVSLGRGVFELVELRLEAAERSDELVPVFSDFF